MWPVVASPDRGSYFYGSGEPTMNMLDQFIASRGLYYSLSDLKLKRRTRLDPPSQPGDPPVVSELETIDADVFDSDLMITSKEKRRPKHFEFWIDKNNVVKHNNGYSDHFPIVTTIQTV